ncbi:Oidioi.mRNA.OKI2018_I69.chr2.g7619.t1.cds [Oikopleura dioica]|uniref:Oidioi.mRNA.OKI2018_I69.chr2.g7619.t1.cds n=1 Tax=Oikopleura dioica TaxID=34765 RepID=A0ABN7TBH4_OIKDI|nr:Oidioi.mRNA.OKI2018_I69.chr2.g7619.t1.cds [Oikopleura dioica]
MSDKPSRMVHCPPGTILPKELEETKKVVAKLAEFEGGSLELVEFEVPEGMNVPGPATPGFRPLLLSAGNGTPRNISVIFYSDHQPPANVAQTVKSQTDAFVDVMFDSSYITISESNPHLIKFIARTEPCFIDDKDSHLPIVGFIRAVSDQFAKQAGRNIDLWRDKPCKLNFFEKIKVQNEWEDSALDWLVPKCQKVGFHCEAHKLNKKVEFITMQSEDGVREGIVRVLNA